MGVGGVGSSAAYRSISETSSTQTAAPAQTTQAPSGPDAGKVAADVFRTILDPLGLFSSVGKDSNPNQWMTDKIMSDVSASSAPRQAYSNYNWQGRNDLTRQLGKQLGTDCSNWINQQVAAGRIPTQAEIDAFLGPRSDQIEQQVNAQFGTPPPNPDVAPAPKPAYDWKGRSAEAKAMGKELGNLTSEWVTQQVNAGRIPSQAEIDAFLGPRSAQIDQQLNAKYGAPPQILEASPKDPNYDYARRSDVTRRVATEVSDQIMNMVQSGASPEACSQFAAQASAQMEQRINSECGVPNPPPAYSAQNDTPELYSQNRYAAEQQIQQMQESGASQDKIQAYALQRQAELAQIFPKQSLLNETMETWKATAQQMQANGKSEGEIKDWLNKKAEKFTEPTAEELQVYSQRKANEAAQIQALVAQANQQAAQMKKYQDELKKQKEGDGGYW